MQRAECASHTVPIVSRVHGLRYAAPVKQIIYFSDSQYVAARVGQIVQHSGPGRGQRKIPSSLGPKKIAARPPKRSCDNPTDIMWWHKNVSRRSTITIEIVARDDIFVSGDLKYTVLRCVNDWMGSTNMLVTQAPDNLGTAGGNIPNDAPADAHFERLDNIW